MRGLEEVSVFQRRHTSLASFGIHLLELRHGELLNGRLDSSHDRFVIREVGSERFQADHAQSSGSFQGAMDMVVLSRCLCLVQVGRHTAVRVRLRLQKIGIWYEVRLYSIDTWG